MKTASVTTIVTLAIWALTCQVGFCCNTGTIYKGPVANSSANASACASASATGVGVGIGVGGNATATGGNATATGGAGGAGGTVNFSGGNTIFVPPIRGLGTSEPPYNPIFDPAARPINIKGNVPRRSKIVTAESHYDNPYFEANLHYLPRKVGDPQWVGNPFLNDPLATPPKPLSTIIVHDTGEAK